MAIVGLRCASLRIPILSLQRSLQAQAKCFDARDWVSGPYYVFDFDTNKLLISFLGVLLGMRGAKWAANESEVCQRWLGFFVSGIQVLTFCWANVSLPCCETGCLAHHNHGPALTFVYGQLTLVQQNQGHLEKSVDLIPTLSLAFKSPLNSTCMFWKWWLDMDTPNHLRIR